MIEHDLAKSCVTIGYNSSPVASVIEGVLLFVKTDSLLRSLSTDSAIIALKPTDRES